MQRQLIAILRGVQSHEVCDICEVILAAGISRIEVPLNSPNAFRSIALLVKRFAHVAQIGAGTVTTVDQVHVLNDLGAHFVVSPNCDVRVIQATKDKGLTSYPGVLTPSECFTALDHGADALKLFPASLLGVQGLSAIRTVLPSKTALYPVGGVGPSNFLAWRKVGATGFGLGSSLYEAGDSVAKVATSAAIIVAAYDLLEPME